MNVVSRLNEGSRIGQTWRPALRGRCRRWGVPAGCEESCALAVFRGGDDAAEQLSDFTTQFYTLAAANVDGVIEGKAGAQLNGLAAATAEGIPAVVAASVLEDLT